MDDPGKEVLRADLQLVKRALPTAGMKRADPQRVRKEHSQLQARNEDQNDVMNGKSSLRWRLEETQDR